MQNLPTVSALPVASASAPTSSTSTATSTDINAAGQPVEPFGHILARQQSSSSSSQNTKKTDSKQTKSSLPLDSTGIIANSQPLQVPSSDASSLPGSILAAFLPASTITSNPVNSSTDKTSFQDSSPGVSNTLASDMLAMMLPANPGGNITVANGKDIKEPLAKVGNIIASESNTIDLLNGKLQSTLKKSTSGVSGINGANSIPNIPELTGIAGLTNGDAEINGISSTATVKGDFQISKETPAISVTSVKEGVFFSAVQALSKQSADSSASNTVGATGSQLQQAVPAVIDSSLQNAALINNSSQNSLIQAAQTVINTPVSNQAWGNEFNQKITWMATQNHQTAELHLNPPNLGPLDVVLKVSGDQATALFTSPHAAVRDAVQQALPQLREMLAGNGITLGNAMVSDQSSRDHQAWQANQQQRNNRGSTGMLDTSVTSGSISTVSATSLVTRHHGLVDTFA